MDDWWSGQEREGSLSSFSFRPLPTEHRAFISDHSLSKYITSKFLSTHNYLYRLHCKMDKESSLRGVFRQQQHSTSWTSYRIMGVSYRQTSLWTWFPWFLTVAAPLCSWHVCIWGCVWMFLRRVRLQQGQSFAAKCFIFWDTSLQITWTASEH